MKTLAYLSIVVAVISLVVAIISRATLIPVPIVRGVGLEAEAFLRFTNTCLLFAITLILLNILKSKK